MAKLLIAAMAIVAQAHIRRLDSSRLRQCYNVLDKVCPGGVTSTPGLWHQTYSDLGDSLMMPFGWFMAAILILALLIAVFLL